MDKPSCFWTKPTQIQIHLRFVLDIKIVHRVMHSCGQLFALCAARAFQVKGDSCARPRLLKWSMTTLEVFGCTIKVNAYDQRDKLAVLADSNVAQMLLDAHDIEEPVAVDGHKCLVTYIDDLDLRGVYTDKDVHFLEVVFSPLH